VIDFDLHTAIEETIGLVTSQADEKGLELTCFIHHDVPALLRGDPGRLCQILLNLLGNAVKFTSEGEVALRVTFDAETVTQATVRFEVSDTGIGIPREKRTRLFQSFSQVDTSTTRKFGGTGLGLVISKQLCELMGGKIGVESEVGVGSTFWFTVVLKKQSDSPHIVSPISVACIQGMRVLIVDDNATNRKILAHYLTRWGCIHDETEGGAQALEKLRKAVVTAHPFDVAVLDFQMPGMDGEELGRAIHAEASLCHLPLLLLTSMGQRSDAKRMEAAGFSGYLIKPVKPSQLFECLASVMGGESRRAGVQASRRAGELAPSLPRPLASSAQQARMRLLLVEDNLVNQKVAIHILQKVGYRCDAAANGLEAIEALSRIPYDLILMDCQMPEMDSFEATAVIRAREKEGGTHVPIIAMTANAMQGDRERCLEAGMDDYISKPVKPENLIAVLETWLHQKSASAEEQRPTSDASEPSPEPPAVDFTGVRDIAGGDPAFLAELVEEFLKGTSQMMTALKAALHQVEDSRNGADAQTARREAHSIKGSAATFGAETLREIAFHIEKLAAHGNLAAASELLTTLNQEWIRVEQEVQRMLTEIGK
jgi:CheY-like chemotaxis protein/HPt (histidine-containing phosphotransfer) domain-containing protein